jgi:hypothetical protein
VTLVELWDAIQRGGLPFVLFLLLVTGYRQMWVWGYLYRAERREKEEWKELALSGTSLARHAARTAETAVKGKPEEVD